MASRDTGNREYDHALYKSDTCVFLCVFNIKPTFLQTQLILHYYGANICMPSFHINFCLCLMSNFIISGQRQRMREIHAYCIPLLVQDDLSQISRKCITLLSACTALFVHAEPRTPSHCYFRTPVRITRRVMSRGHEPPNSHMGEKTSELLMHV